MDFQILENLEQIDADVIVVGVREGTADYDQRFVHITGPLLESGDLPLKALETIVVPGKPKIVLAGVAKSGDAEAWRRAAATVIRRVRKARRFAFIGGDARAITEGALVGSFSTGFYKAGDEKPAVERLCFIDAPSQAVEQGRLAGESINWARQLIAEPSNRKPPRIAAERAKAMAAEAGLTAVVLDEAQIRVLKMGALLGVSQGSEEPPRVVVVSHFGKPGSSKMLAYVGKGITFDTGGISLKPAEGMEKMKYDMAGGAASLAALRILAGLRAPLNCMAVVPFVENMPGGRAQRPGDVVEAMNGKTIEIISTDAEGRLILADALAYAQHLGATHLVDIATLTGACRIALGSVRVAVMGNPQSYVDRFLSAAERAGEKMWQLPMDEEYHELIRSSVADLANSGGRFAGAITGAKMLQAFAGDLPWIHLDIAGTAWNDDEKPYLPKGPSGVAVRSLVEFALDFAEDA